MSIVLVQGGGLSQQQIDLVPIGRTKARPDLRRWLAAILPAMRKAAAKDRK